MSEAPAWPNRSRHTFHDGYQPRSQDQSLRDQYFDHQQKRRGSRIMDTQDFGDVKAWLPMSDPRLDNFRGGEFVLLHVVRKAREGFEDDHLIVFAQWSESKQAWVDTDQVIAGQGVRSWTTMPPGYIRRRLSLDMQVAWSLGYPVRTVEDIMTEARRVEANGAAAK